MSDRTAGPVQELVMYGTTDDYRHADSAAATPVHYQPGQFLFYEGHKPYGVYLLNDGAIELYRTVSGNPLDEPEFRCAVEARIDEGRPLVIGARQLQEDQAFPVNARAHRRIEGIFIDRTTLRENPGLQEWLCRFSERSGRAG